MDPYLQDFNFCIFWWSWLHTIIFCWNFDWDPKSNLGPALEQCEKDLGLGAIWDLSLCKADDTWSLEEKTYDLQWKRIIIATTF